MEEDDLLMPYKEVSYEDYERKEDENSIWVNDSNDSAEMVDVQLEKVNNEEITEKKELPPLDLSSIPKRGRPRKPKPPTPEPVKESDDSSMWETDSNGSVVELIGDQPEKINIEVLEKKTIVVSEKKEIPPVDISCIPKRGRPRKPKPPTPDPSELQNNREEAASCTHNETGVSFESNGNIDVDTSTTDISGLTPVGFKRTRGRPRRGESTVNSQKQLMQSLKYIIPDGTKRKSRPSRFLDDYDAFWPQDSTADGEEPETKRRRGRPRIKPPKMRVLLPDGTPRGRGRPRLNPFIGPLTEAAMKMELSEIKTGPGEIKMKPGEIINVKKESSLKGSELSQPTTSHTTTGQRTTNGSLNGGVFVKPRRGRPRKYPIGEKKRNFPKRVSKTGKKMGRPRKGFEKWRQLTPEAISVPNQKWQIKLDGLLKYVTGGKLPHFKKEILGKPNGASTPIRNSKAPKTEVKLGSDMAGIHKLVEHSAEKENNTPANADGGAPCKNQILDSTLQPNNSSFSKDSATKLELEASCMPEINSVEIKGATEDTSKRFTKTHSELVQNGIRSSAHTTQQVPGSVGASEDSNDDYDESDLSTELSSESEYSDMDDAMSVDDSSDEDDHNSGDEDGDYCLNQTMQPNSDTLKTISESKMTNSSLETPS